MKPTRNALLLATLALNLLTLSPAWCSASSPGSESMALLKDPVYFISILFPSDWKTDSATEPDSFLRLSAMAPDGGVFIGIYAFKRPGTIELEKLAKADSELFKDLGVVQKTQKIRKFLIHTKAIEKTYSKNSRGIYTLARYEAYGTYGYIIVVLSKSSNFTTARPILESLKVKVPALTNLKNMFSQPGQWLGKLFISLLLIGCIFLLGKTGRLVRRGVEMRKQLLKVKNEGAGEGKEVNKQWYIYCRKAYCLIIIPSLGWGILYLLTLVYLPFKLFAFSLLLLLIPILGYFGIFFVPSDDAADYLPK